jgi:hypothetical protein
MAQQPEGSRVRSYPIHSNEAIHDQYNRTGLALAIFAALFFFIALWGLNGYFTARTVRSLGTLLGLSAFSWGSGWLVHVVVSLIEHHLFKLKEALGNAPALLIVVIYILIVVVGSLDVFTSTLAFLDLFSQAGLSPTNPTVRFVAVLFAEVIAIVPEPVIVWLCIALWRVTRS